VIVGILTAAAGFGGTRINGKAIIGVGKCKASQCSTLGRKVFSGKFGAGLSELTPKSNNIAFK
jgi:hypothetical protein